MDYFFWDDIFNGRQNLADDLLDLAHLTTDEPEVTPDLVAVVITSRE